MTKADLIMEVARQTALTKKESEIVIKTIFNSIINALVSGDKVELRGLGSFRIRNRKPRVGRNPKTGNTVNVPPKKVPFFKAGKELRSMVDY